MVYSKFGCYGHHTFGRLEQIHAFLLTVMDEAHNQRVDGVVLLGTNPEVVVPGTHFVMTEEIVATKAGEE